MQWGWQAGTAVVPVGRVPSCSAHRRAASGASGRAAAARACRQQALGAAAAAGRRKWAPAAGPACNHHPMPRPSPYQASPPLQ